MFPFRADGDFQFLYPSCPDMFVFICDIKIPELFLTLTEIIKILEMHCHKVKKDLDGSHRTVMSHLIYG